MSARTPLPASLLESQIRSAIQSVDPTLPIFNIRSMNDVMDVSVFPPIFGGVGRFIRRSRDSSIFHRHLWLAGLHSWPEVSQIGIRIALGAQRPDILKLILSAKGYCSPVIELRLIDPFSAISARMIAGLLYGVHPIDVVVFVTVPLIGCRLSGDFTFPLVARRWWIPSLPYMKACVRLETKSKVKEKDSVCLRKIQAQHRTSKLTPPAGRWRTPQGENHDEEVSV